MPTASKGLHGLDAHQPLPSVQLASASASVSGGAIIPVLDKDNYAIWVIRLRGMLEEAGVYYVVENGLATAPPALANDATPAQHAAHASQRARVAADNIANLKARNIILRYVSDQHARAVSSAATAQEAWEQLAAEFVQVSIARQSQLQVQLSQLRMQADETVAGFFARTMLLRDELTSAGCPPSDHSLMLAVLNAMPPEFKIAIQLLRYQLTVGNADLDVVKKVLLQSEADYLQEQSIQSSQSTQPGSTLWSSSFTYSRGRGPLPSFRRRGSSPVRGALRGGYTAGRGGVIPTASTPVSSQQQGRSSRPVCQYCNYPGHVLSECRRYARDHGSFARPASPSLAQAQLSPNRPRGNSPSRGRGDGSVGRSADSAGSSMQQQSDAEPANVLFMARTNRFPMLSRTEPVATPLPGHLVPENMTDEEFLDLYARMPRWVIDSGANRHIMPWRSCLSNYHTFDPPIQLQLGGQGSSIDVLGEGTTYLTNSQGEQWAVSGVLHAPAAAYCYLSVSELTRAGVTLRFHGDHCDLIGRGNPPEWQMTVRKAPPGVYLWHIRAVAEGRRVMGDSAQVDDTHLYDPDNIYNPLPHAFHMQPNELDPQVWHQRCGHASFSVLTRMQREGMVNGVPVKQAAFAEAASSAAICPGCAMGKQHRRVRFDLSTNAPPVTAALGLIHMDVCGPMPHAGRDGSRYIATFLDEHTGLSVIQLLSSKDQVPAAVQRVITELETQSGQRCKALRSDNGSEYSNKIMSAWCSSKGIQQQFSAPYCPEQNGKAERLNRTIMQATRSMLLTAQLPPGFWVDAALKANYVRNLLPITGQPVTPWEAFYHRKPNLSALRVFGATAWVFVTQPNRNKLQPKAVKGILLGYAVGSKAYKLWVNGRLIISKDVQIDETAVLEHHRNLQLPVQSPVPSMPAPAPAPPPPAHSSLPLHAPAPSAPALVFQQPPSPPSPQPPLSPASPLRPPLQQQQLQPQQQAPQLQQQAPQQQTPQPQLSGQSSPSPSRHSARAAGGEASSSTSSSAAASSGSTAAEHSVGGGLLRPGGSPSRGPVGVNNFPGIGRFRFPGLRPIPLAGPTALPPPPANSAPAVAAPDAPLPAASVMPDAPRRNPARSRQPPIRIRQPELGSMTASDTSSSDTPTVLEALSGPHAEYWREAMHTELASLHANGTWTLVERPSGARVLPTKWVLKIKRDATGAIEKFKARLVNQGTLQLDQQQYIKELLSTYSMTEAHSKAVPMAPGTKLVKEGDALDTAHHSYSALVGSLLYLSCCTRPDIAYAVGALARHLAAPTQQHWAAAKAVLSYLKGTASQGLVFGGSDSLQGYCDADYAGDKDTARSTTGYVFTLHGAAISWSSRLQPTVAMSTAEAEYMAASGAVKEAVWLRKLMQDLGLPGTCVNIMCDNQAALQLLNNPMASARSKHISVHHHFARERAVRGEVMFTYCSTSEMVADVMTKPLAAVKLGYAKEGCGISSIASASVSGGAIIPVLDKDNYAIWVIRLRGMLEEAGVYYVVENGLATAPPALANDATPAQHAAHASQRARVAADNIANLKARNIILRYVSDQHARAVSSAATAQEAWEQLAAEFVQVSIARQSQLQVQLSQLRMQADETVAGFFARTMLLRDELTSAGCPPSDHSLMLAVLNAMPPEFKIAIQLLRYQLTVGNADLDVVKKVLLQSEADYLQEQSIQSSQSTQPGSTLWSSSFTYSRGRGPLPSFRRRGSSPVRGALRGGYTAGRGGVIPTASTPVSSQQQGRSSRPVCQYCNYPGHVLSECRRYARDHGSFARPASPSLAQAQLSPNRPRGNSPSRGRGDGSVGRSADSAGSSMQQQSDAEPANVLFMARTNRFPMLSRTEPVATPLPGHLVPENMTDEEFLDLYARMPRWVIDSGANRHIMPWRSCLSNYHTFDPPIQLQLGGQGSSIDVLGEGTTYLTNSQGEQWAVSGVLHAPAAAYCYLSVSELTRAGVTLRFHGDHCDLIGRGNPPEWQMTVRKAPPGVYLWHIRAVAEGRRVMGDSAQVDDTHLYDPDNIYNPLPHAFHMQPNELDPQVWHQRCGHASFSVLTRMQREGMVNGVPVKQAAFAEAASSAAICPGCAMGKQHRRVRFDLSTNAPPVTAALGLIHMDVCGPMPHAGRDGSRYIATFLDEHTGLSVIQLLSSKDQVPAAVQRVITELETQSGQRCKALRSDNGSEYSNKIMSAWCSSKGIQQQFSAPYCPEQNGKAERLNRTIMQATRSMLLTAQLPPGFWVDAALKANYVRNLLPITGQPVTPWEAFYHRKPNLSALRVFGATAWVFVTQPNRNKLQPKAVKGILLGYAVGSKAYKLWVNGRLIISKDVQIDETAVLEHHRNLQLPVQSPVPSMPAPAPAPPPPAHSSLPLHAPAPSAPALVFQQPPSPPSPQPPLSPASPLEATFTAATAAASAAGAAASAAGAAAANTATSAVGPKQSLPQQTQRKSCWGGGKQQHQLFRCRKQIRQPELGSMTASDTSSSDTPTVLEALSGPHAEYWREAMHTELASLHANGTWTLVERPSGARVLPTKWVLKIKRDATGAIEKFKARLVAKGFMQVSGVDVGDVYAPVSKHTTLRSLLALAAARDMEVHQIDVEAAFLNGTLQPDEVIHIQQPEGFEEGSPNTVCRLQKALYGLRQAPRAWHAKLKQELEGMGFCASESDPALFMLSRPAGTVYLLVYVDDCLLCTEKGDLESLDFVKQRLSSVFGIKDLGQTRWFLGMQISRDRAQGTLQLDQQQYIKELLSTYNMTEAHSKAVPMAPGTKLVKEGDALDTAHHSYSALVGSLLYLSCCTRPDIAYAVGALARHLAAPTQQHWAAPKAVLSYLKGTASQGLVFGGSDSLQGYCDADYAGDKDTARSTTGYVFTLHGAAISWSSRLQPTVAMSTAEAEYMAASGAVKEAVWLRKLMQDLGLPGTCVNIMCDNQAALQLLNNPMASARSKHISVHHHFARERAVRGEVMFTYCSTSEMVADVMTKPLAAVKLGYAKEGCGISSM
ncbi:hypothetical protein QJQ45_005317 [Haematococcus lacustris]|nr:hypothetical protein QJQ45_005317 [Haematococcus lacustris]